MAALIGILFFVVLLMALDMVQQAVSEGGLPMPDTEALEDELAGLRHQRDDVQGRVDYLREWLGKAPALSEEELERDIHDKAGELQGLHKAVEEANDDVERDSAKLADRRQRAGEARQAAGQARQEAEDILAGLESATPQTDDEGNKLVSVTYIRGVTTDKRRPWLVEVNGESIRVGDADGLSSRADYLVDDPTSAFLRWAKRQDPKEVYFVLIVKPAGVADYKTIREALLEADFAVGTDTMPSYWDPFRD